MCLNIGLIILDFLKFYGGRMLIRIIFFLILTLLSFVIISCDSDRKSVLTNNIMDIQSLNSDITMATNNNSNYTAPYNNNSCTIKGLILDSSNTPITDVFVEIISISNPEIKYQTLTNTSSSNNNDRIYNFIINNIPYGTYSVTLTKSGYIKKDFKITINENNIYIETKLHFKLSADLGFIKAHYNGNNPPKDRVKEILIYRYITQNGVKVSNDFLVAKIDTMKNNSYNSKTGVFRFKNLSETIEYKIIKNSNGIVKEFKMHTWYKIVIVFNNGTTIKANNIEVKSGEPTLVKINESNDTGTHFAKIQKIIPELISPKASSLILNQKPKFSWESIPKTNTYILEIYADKNKTPTIYQVFLNLAELDKNNNSIIYSNYSGPLLKRGRTYYWRVGAVNKNNEPIQWSQLKSFTIIKAPPTPINLTATNTSTTTVKLSWNLPTDITIKDLKNCHFAGFYIYRKQPNQETLDKPLWILYWDGNTISNFIFKDNIENSKIYEYSITSFSSYGIESAMSNSVTISTNN